MTDDEIEKAGRNFLGRYPHFEPRYLYIFEEGAKWAREDAKKRESIRVAKLRDAITTAILQSDTTQESDPYMKVLAEDDEMENP